MVSNVIERKIRNENHHLSIKEFYLHVSMSGDEFFCVISCSRIYCLIFFIAGGFRD